MWPRREVGREQAKGDVPVANATPGAPGAAQGAPGTAPNAGLAPPKPPAAKKPAQQTNPFGNFFGGGGFGNSPQPRQAPAPRAPRLRRARRRRSDNAPRFSNHRESFNPRGEERGFARPEP